MIERYFGRIIWVALLLAGVTLGGLHAFAQSGGEQRFKLTGPESQQPTPGPQVAEQPAAGLESGNAPAPDQATSDPAPSAQAPLEQTTPDKSIPEQPASAPVSEQPTSTQTSPDQPGETVPPAATQDQASAGEAEAVSKPEDDLPPPMRVEGNTKQLSKSVPDVKPSPLAGKPLEIVPIREGKLSNLSGEKQPAKSGKVSKSSQAKQARTVRPFWLNPKRPAADLSFKQGAVAFILGADIGRRGTYKTFLLDNPVRRVVDIPGPWRYDGPTNHPVRFDGVGSIRVGEHPNYLRIVFDYVKGEARPPSVHTTPDGVSVIYFWGE